MSRRRRYQANTDIGGPGGMNIAEGDYLPIVRVAPVYPARALSRGLEGFVDLSFHGDDSGHGKGPDCASVDQQPVRTRRNTCRFEVQVQTAELSMVFRSRYRV